MAALFRSSISLSPNDIQKQDTLDAVSDDSEIIVSSIADEVERTVRLA